MRSGSGRWSLCPNCSPGKRTESRNSQTDMLPVAVAPPEEQATIDRALEILESRLRKNEGSIASTREDIVTYLRLMLADKPAEEFMIVFLDCRHRLIEARTLFKGTVDGCAVYPREVVRAVIEVNAAAVCLAHAHPSQNPEPSEADKAITMKLGQALALIDVRLFDHIVIGGMEHVSLAERGWI